MIRYLIHRPTTDGKVYAVIAGLSTDAKPTAGLITGSRFVEADTGAGYLFNETGSAWTESQQLTEAVAAYLDEHPEALDQAAIEAMFSDQLDGIEEDVGGLKSALNLSGFVFNYTVTPGYFLDTGATHAATANKEVYTSKIPVEKGCRVGFNIQHASSHTMWVAYVTYDASQNFVQRVVLLNSVSGTKYNTSLYIGNDTVKYIAFTYRTFDDAQVSIYGDYGAKTAVDVQDNFEYFKYKTNNLHDLADYGYVDYSEKVELSTYGISAERFGTRVKINFSGSSTVQRIKMDGNLSISAGSSNYKQWVGSCYLQAGVYYKISVKLVSGTSTKSNAVYIPEPVVYNFSSSYDKITDLASYAARERSGYFIAPNSALIIGMFIDSPVDMTDAVFDVCVEAVNLSGTMNYDINSNVKSINHRGYSNVAPENTLPAYVLSKKMGFEYVETDVQFTSDGVAVCLHDQTINRTARNVDGTALSETVSINDITYEDALDYDFGIWKNAAYAGTKIPTFEQFILLCRNIGLYPYIELKDDGSYTQQQITGLVDKVKSYGMKGKVTWISSNSTYLGYIAAYDDTARLGYIKGEAGSTVISTAIALKTGKNEVFIDIASGGETSESIADCIANDLPMEVWTINAVGGITGLDPYISGVTSNIFVAGVELYKNSIT